MPHYDLSKPMRASSAAGHWHWGSRNPFCSFHAPSTFFTSQVICILYHVEEDRNQNESITHICTTQYVKSNSSQQPPRRDAYCCLPCFFPPEARLPWFSVPVASLSSFLLLTMFLHKFVFSFHTVHDDSIFSWRVVVPLGHVQRASISPSRC